MRTGFMLIVAVALLAVAQVILPASMLAIDPIHPNTTPGRDSDINTDTLQLSYFLPNLGQVKDPSVLYYTADGSCFVTQGGYWLVYEDIYQCRFDPKVGMRSQPQQVQGQGICLRYSFQDANSVNPVPSGVQSWSTNYFLGERVYTGIPSYSQVTFPELWSGIDLTLKPAQGGLKYELELRPGADPADISMGLIGQNSMDITKTGDLRISTEMGDIMDSGLIAYYSDEDAGALDCSFEADTNSFGFALADRDPTRAIIIDPLVFSTFVGGTSNDVLFNLKVDDSGYIYACGSSESLDFPTTPGSYSPDINDLYDVVVIKMEPDASQMVYATYVGGASSEYAYDICIDAQGCAYVAGYTCSDDMPTTPSAYDMTFEGGSYYNSDAFAFKLNETGDGLYYSTLLGSVGDDMVMSMDITPSGQVVLGGWTDSPSFPTTSGAYQPTFALGNDAFITRLDVLGSALDMSTFVGGSDNEVINCITLDAWGGIYATGNTRSDDLQTTPGSFGENYGGGGSDAFVLKLNATGSAMDHLSYLGGADNDDVGLGLALDSFNNTYVTGYTDAYDFPVTSGAFDTEFCNGSYHKDMFITKVDPSGTAFVYSTFVGGDDYDIGDDIVVDSSGNAFVTGLTYSYDFPIFGDAIDLTYNGDDSVYDAVLLELSEDGGQVWYSTFIGGSGGDDEGMALCLAPYKNLYVAGYTGSADLPTTTGTLSPTFNGGNVDGFVMRLNLTIDPGAPRLLRPYPGDSCVNLTWTAPLNDQNILNYRVYRGLSLLGLSFIGNTGGARTWYNSTGLTNGQTYVFKVSCVNASGEGPLSYAVYAKPLRLPSKPLGVGARLIIDPINDDHINISWTPPLDNGGDPNITYNLYRGTTTDGLMLYVDNLPKTYFHNYNIYNGVTYYYQVSATNELGEGSRSDMANATYEHPPVGVDGFALAYGDGFVNITWEPPIPYDGGPADGYYIFRGQSKAGMTLFNTTTDTFFNDTTVVNGITYYYNVSAYNKGGEGPYSVTLRAEPMGHPGAVMNLTAKTADRTIKLSWAQPFETGGAVALDYIVYRSQDEYIFKTMTRTDELQYTDSSLVNGQLYHYRISAVNALFEGAYAQINAVPMRAPSEPLSLSFDAGNGYVNLSWRSPLDDGGDVYLNYTVYRGPSEAGLVPYATNVSQTWYRDTAVVNGITYFYAVCAYNIKGEGAISPVIMAKPAGPPSKPLNLSAEAGDVFVNITWDAPLSAEGANIVSYVIYRGPSPDSLIRYKEVPDLRGYNDTLVINGQTYFYIVRASNIVGEGAPSDGVNATPMKNTTPIVPPDDDDVDDDTNVTDDDTGDDDVSPVFYALIVALGIIILILIIVIIMIGLMIRRSGKESPAPKIGRDEEPRNRRAAGEDDIAPRYEDGHNDDLDDEMAKDSTGYPTHGSNDGGFVPASDIDDQDMAAEDEARVEDPFEEAEDNRDAGTDGGTGQRNDIEGRANIAREGTPADGVPPPPWTSGDVSRSQPKGSRFKNRKISGD